MSKKRFAAGILAALMAFTALAVVLAGSVSAKPKAAKATFQAALVSDVGRFNDKSFNQSQLAGLNRAKKVLKIKVLPIQSNNTSDYVPNLTTAVRRGSNIVIAAGFLMAPSLKDLAPQFPKTHFAITDDFVSSSVGDFKGADVHNVEGLTYATQENSYLIGCMAAMVAKSKYKGTPTIGVVGGIKIPPVDTFLAGYRADKCSEACGQRCLQRHRSGEEGEVQGRKQRCLQPEEQRGRAREDQPSSEGQAQDAGAREGRDAAEADHLREDQTADERLVAD